ncbi:hypothetical protein K469DRAFT_687165 [Zopfia rhizophila CBS 207.26]|uniref:Uncharacterized protein n=1 Tax=Zopfia rhizophila CBS 207.26 TaxID=1314779 RepID=A0A6A6E2H6_9PEZI|nr:hypothetical protein K469DRAFT_687165 [Zopfia rhizophila CBS 207.26]
MDPNLDPAKDKDRDTIVVASEYENGGEGGRASEDSTEEKMTQQDGEEKTKTDLRNYLEQKSNEATMSPGKMPKRKKEGAKGPTKTPQKIPKRKSKRFLGSRQLPNRSLLQIR